MWTKSRSFRRTEAETQNVHPLSYVLEVRSSCMNIEVEWLQDGLGPLEARHFLALSFLGHGCAGLPRKKSEGSHLWRR